MDRVDPERCVTASPPVALRGDAFFAPGCLDPSGRRAVFNNAEPAAVFLQRVSPNRMC